MTSRHHHHHHHPTNVPIATTNYIGRSIPTTSNANLSPYSPPEEKIRVLCLGDSGTGKSSLVRRLANGGVPPRTSGVGGWTIGVELEVVYQHQDNLMVEIWDVGGHEDYADARRVFYNQINAIMLVYDVTNKKSAFHLRKWLDEVVQEDREKRRKARIGVEEFVEEPLNVYGGGGGGGGVGGAIPILIVGNKMDLISPSYSPGGALMDRLASLASAGSAATTTTATATTMTTNEDSTSSTSSSSIMLGNKLPQIPTELLRFNHILTSSLSATRAGDEAFESFFRAALERKKYLKRAGR